MATFKVIILPIANYLFAVPMNKVLQVLRCPPNIRNSPVDSELTHLDDRPVLVLNLQVRLQSSSSSAPQSSLQSSLQPSLQPSLQSSLLSSKKHRTAGADKFLVLTQSRTGYLCGLRVDRLPDILDLPDSAIQLLPESYRQNNLQGLAKYVAILPNGERKMVIYLLELEELLQSKHSYPALA